LVEIVKFSRRRKPLISKATQPFVRLQTFLFLYLGPLLIACAYQGTIVEKAGRPLPFAYSFGIDASFKFAPRDHLGRVRWQLVSAEVFNSYRVGDYFDDESPMPRRRRCSTDGKEMPYPPAHETIPIFCSPFSADSVGAARSATLARASWSDERPLGPLLHYGSESA
jgi:hypothetical protein